MIEKKYNEGIEKRMKKKWKNRKKIERILKMKEKK